MSSQFIKLAKNNVFLHTFMIALAILAGYYGLWRAYFFSDDYWMLGWVRHEPSLAHAITAQFGYGVRFLLDALLYTRVKLYDLDPAPYYWSSLVQHLIVAMIAYGLALLWSRRRVVAFLTALLFATSFAHYEVITWITGSEYSFAAILYLGTLGQFALFLRTQRRGWYAGSLVTFVMLLLFLEMFLSLPLVLGAYHLTLGRAGKSLGSLIRWQTVLLHAPYWLLMGIYLALQLSFVQAGSSEAVVAQVRYGPGLHMPGNFYYLAYLIIPDVHYAVLNAWFGPTFVSVVRWVTLFVALAGNGLALYGLWKGSDLVRFAIAFIYLTFLPYTLWEGGFAGAFRYRYLPAIGFSLLVALWVVRLHNHFVSSRHKAPRLWLRYALPTAVGGVVLLNVAVLQVWVQRHIENSDFRRTFVTGLLAEYGQVEPGTRILIEVPEIKYVDLGEVCQLLYAHAVECEAVWAENVSVEEADDALYWLRATPDGIEQIFPLAERVE